ncbi:MAG: PHP domain-containing protein, partial [Clostridiales bacterium]|nr:PHP domain-containing protein [Clostridiales bacterium]
MTNKVTSEEGNIIFNVADLNVGNKPYADLHLHTIASDGTWSASFLVKKLLENDVVLFAVTDHDSIESLSEAENAAKKACLSFIRGIEISSIYDGVVFHILGYNILPEHHAITEVIEYNRNHMEEEGFESIIWLQKKGFRVSAEDYEIYLNNTSRGGWKILNYLIDKKLCTNHKDFFNLFNGDKAPFTQMEFVSPIEAAKAIKSAGGVPMFAHPGVNFFKNGH